MYGVYQCPFCGMQVQPRSGGNYLRCICENCGSYKISGDALEDLPHEFSRKYKNKNHLVAGYLRELNEIGLEPEIVTNENIESLINSGRIPKTLGEKLNKLLIHIYRKGNTFFLPIQIKMSHTAISYAATEEELSRMIAALQESGYITGFPAARIDKTVDLSLTTKGIEKAENLLTDRNEGNQCFVAMWFSDEMHQIYETYISKAIVDCGYKSLIISQKEHNDKICDEIIAEIRKSRFIVADFTAHRGGVYFEAGFAYGLGIPVIWTCRKDHLDKAHFDINHYNFVVWESGEELCQKLTNRIKATII